MQKQSVIGGRFFLENAEAFRHSAPAFAGGHDPRRCSLPNPTMLDDIPASADCENRRVDSSLERIADVDYA
jgi:hypothetical protein